MEEWRNGQLCPGPTFQPSLSFRPAGLASPLQLSPALLRPKDCAVTLPPLSGPLDPWADKIADYQIGDKGGGDPCGLLGDPPGNTALSLGRKKGERPSDDDYSRGWVTVDMGLRRQPVYPKRGRAGHLCRRSH
ncbi:MAG: hypothetical protein DPW09_28985 [Anaerolineae bacterium]|nr:hypothetical protein [Anaerolineales bacterium]MCQ3977484.1 hypothetical protein [Anaerolineae bacterium]